MNYNQVLEYIYNRLPMFQRIGASAYKNSLDTTIALDNYFNNPHKHFATIHIAGTNGKGSVSHLIASVLQEAGYKTGLYTSPHLKDYRERIKINGEMISEKFVTDFINEHRRFFEPLNPSFFELSVALSFEYFKKNRVDIAVVETGMGGRLDSTNIIKPIISVITNISLDHTQFLGDTLEKIAVEKAGIIKKHIPVVLGESNTHILPVFMQATENADTQLLLASNKYVASSSFQSSDAKQCFTITKGGETKYKNLKVELLGKYQNKNIVTAITALTEIKRKFNFSDENLFNGFANVIKNTGLLGRWQILNNNPLTICDTAHNEAGINEVVNQIKLMNFKKLHFIFGVVADKQSDSILKLLPENATYYFTKAQIPRALDAYELKQKAASYNLQGNAYNTVNEALNAAKQAAEVSDLIFIGGSTFVVAEVI